MKPLAYGMLVLFIFAFSAPTYAQGFSTEAFLNATFDEEGNLPPGTEGQLELATAQFGQLPDGVKALFGNQIIAVDVTLDSGEVEQLGVTMKGNEVQSITRYPPQNPSMKIETDEETVQGIVLSEDKTAAFLQAVNAKDLTYKGLTPSGETAALAADFFSWITLIIKAFLHFFGLD